MGIAPVQETGPTLLVLLLFLPDAEHLARMTAQFGA
jgi:hypothetical protein